jgi:hypothetical protein
MSNFAEHGEPKSLGKIIDGPLIGSPSVIRDFNGMSRTVVRADRPS